MKVTYQQEKALLYHAIGEAVTRWAHIEYGLGLIAVVCMQPDDPKPAFAAFRSIENFRSKVGFTDSAIIASRFAAKINKEWEAAHSRVQSLAKQRNHIAHDRMVCFPEAPQGRRYVLVPKGAPITPGNSPPSSCLGLRRIHQIGRQFGMASSALHDIADLALDREPQHGAAFQIEHPIPQLAQLVRQMQKALAQPREP